MGFEVLDIPRVVVLARSVETDHNLGDVGLGQHTAAWFVQVAGLDLLAVESSHGVADTQPFAIIGTEWKVAGSGDGEGVLGILGVLVARVVAEARQELGILQRAHIAVFVAAVVVGFIVHQHLEVLVAVLLFLGVEVEGHSQLRPDQGKVFLRGAGAGVGLVIRLPEAVGGIVNLFFI